MSSSPFVFEIGADISKFTKSIGEVEDELKKFKTALKTDTGSAIAETNKRIKELETSLVNLKKVGLDSTQSFGKASTNALTSLSLAVQDVSFGFIGIQNNLPGIVQGFSQMTANAKNGASIMSQLGSALIGPAGIYLAFSAVTAIVTKLSMEYGSLGEVMNAIFGKTNALSIKIKELSESYKEFNKQLKTSQDIVGQEKASTSSQITEIQTLSKIILDQTKSYNERNAALNRLKEINKDYFGNLTLETLKTNTLTDAVTGYKDSLVQGAITKGFQEQLSKTNIELSKQQILLENLQDATDAARRAPITISRVTGEQTNTQAIKDAESAYNGQLKVVNDLKKRKAELNKEIQNSVRAQIDLRAPVDAATAALERQKKADKELADSKKFAEKSAESFRKFNGRDISEQEAFSSFVVGTTNLQVKAIDRLIKERVKLRKETSKEASAALAPKIISGKVEPLKNQKFLDTEAFAAELAIAQQLIDSVFFDPIAESFEKFINTGKFSFEEFAKSVKANIAKIVAQIAASKIVELLGAIYAGPIAGALGGGAGSKIGSFLTSLSGFLPTFTQRPSFNGVQGNNTVGMNGSVNLVLRGTDLVGSINRTNSQISRVG
jgi:lambda family phage tail tape measure protein